MNTLVSIIIPVYNREKTLQRLFQSLVLQDYRPLEVILVDNASTDASLEICNEFKSSHSSSDFDISFSLISFSLLSASPKSIIP